MKNWKKQVQDVDKEVSIWKLLMVLYLLKI